MEGFSDNNNFKEWWCCFQYQQIEYNQRGVQTVGLDITKQTGNLKKYQQKIRGTSVVQPVQGLLTAQMPHGNKAKSYGT